jgi:hypothetical protein
LGTPPVRFCAPQKNPLLRTSVLLLGLAVFDCHPFEHCVKLLQSAAGFRFWVRGLF